MVGRRYTTAEDNMIRSIMSTHVGRENSEARFIAYIASNHGPFTSLAPFRSYASYRRRYFDITGPARSVVTPVAAVERTSKRKVCDMTEEELTRYEEKLANSIKKRREVITTQKTTAPKCTVCKKDALTPVIASCKHIFCVECYCKHVTGAPGMNRHCHRCPSCSKDWNSPSNVQVMAPRSTLYECNNAVK